jgi:hypothetical protein
MLEPVASKATTTALRMPSLRFSLPRAALTAAVALIVVISATKPAW